MLFDKAEAALLEHKGIKANINSLERYFYYLADLKTIPTSPDITDPYVLDTGKRYTILPLDEEHFEIDANSRAIKVPDSFKRNGIAVKGDEIAEVVYFRIARYFDFMDLNNTEIFVQWSIQNENNVAVTGISKEWVRDIESDPDYLIFGWALDSRFTKYPGTLKFSVRFVEKNPNYIPNTEGGTEPPYIFSFSTLDAQATINKALDFDYNVLYNDTTEQYLNKLKNMMVTRIERTKTIDTNIHPELPLYTTNLLQWVYAKEKGTLPYIEEGAKEYVYIVDLEPPTAEDLKANPDAKPYYHFGVHAYAPDGGDVEYTYSGKLNSDSKGTVTTIGGSPFYHIFSEKTKSRAGEVYYNKIITEKEDPQNPEAVIQEVKYEVASDVNKPNESLLDTDGQRRPLYEKLYGCKVTEAGEYSVSAINRIETVQSDPSSGNVIPDSKPAVSQKIIVPGPSEKTVTISVKENTNVIEPGSGAIVLGSDYTKPDDTEDGMIDFNKETITYQWMKDEKVLVNSNTAEYKISDQFGVGDQGYYKLNLISHRNGTDKTNSSNEILMTLSPEVPKVALSYTYGGKTVEIKDYSDMGISQNVPIGATVTITPSYTKDYHLKDAEEKEINKTTYEWFIKTGKINDYKDDQSLGIKTNELTLQQSHLGNTIYCKVTNTYNTATKTTNSYAFNASNSIG